MDIKPIIPRRPKATQFILIRLLDDDYTLNYRCQKSSIMRNLMEGFAKRRGIKDIDTMIFTHNGERVMPDTSMGELGFQIGQKKDMIFQSTLHTKPKKEVKDEVKHEVKSEVKPEVKNEDDYVSITFQYGDSSELKFKLAKTAPFKKPMKVFSDKLGMQSSALRFYYMGEQLFAYGTPNEVDMEDGDAVDVTLMRDGGC